MRIPKDVIEEIKRRAEIVEIIGEYVDLKPTSKNNYKGLCPFHNEKTPSFSVSAEGLFHCFGCGESGNTITFLEKYLNLSFYETMLLLANRYGINLHIYNEIDDSQESLFRNIYASAQEYYASLLKFQIGSVAYDYFSERKLLPEIMSVFGLGYSPPGFDNLYKELKRKGLEEQLLIDSGIIRRKDNKVYDFFRGRAMFPIRDFLGRTIAFGARKLSESDTAGKYINSADSIIYDKKQTLYGLFEAKNEIRKKNEAIIVEGYIDVISLHQAGIKNVVAPCGTALTYEQLKSLKKHTNTDVLYLMFDGDTAGQNAAERSIIPALEIGYDLRIIMLSENEDPDSLINSVDGAERFEYLKNHYFSFVDFICKKLANEGKLTTPAEKSATIKNIINIILSVPDKSQHVFYIENIEEIFKISREILREIYLQEKNNVQKNMKKQATTEQKNEKKLIIEEEYNIENLFPEEKEILHFALQGAKNFSILVNEYQISEKNFLSDLGKIIFEIIYEHWDNANIIQAILEDSDIDEHLISIVSELKLINIEENQRWKDFIDFEESNTGNLEKNIVIPLFKLRIKIIDAELEDLRRNMPQADEKFLLQWKLISEERQKLSDTVLKYGN